MQDVNSKTDVFVIDTIFDSHLQTVHTLRQSTYRQRREKLRALRDAILARQDNIETVLYADLHKSGEEARITEIIPTLIELKFAYRHLRRWMRLKRVKRAFPLLLAKSYVKYEPKGRVLIISPWNYPFHLSMVPLITAIAAGNTVILKPSEFSTQTSHVIREIVSSIFDEREVAVIEGGVETAQYLLQKPFDHIFFTGSPDKGRFVMAYAAENLSSVTLELGGKSPVIIDESADIRDAAEKIAWAKFLNAGQTCIAPDYVLIPGYLQTDFSDGLKDAFRKFFTGDITASSYARIVSHKHYERLNALIGDAIDRGASIKALSDYGNDGLFLPPVILTDVDLKSDVMSEEIFGPLLPVISVSDCDGAIAIVNSLPKPLAIYIFGKDKQKIKRILERTSAGGTCINDCVVHLSNPHLPFGGVNNSGMGRYHGFHGFEELSNKRAIFKQSRLNVLKLIYPPYSRTKRFVIEFLLRYFSR
jgi:aldehyde dehydrogenase (NAD+)